MNIWYVIGFIRPITWGTVLTAYATGLWFDIAHAVSTVIFLLLLAKPWGKLLNRIKIKYGLMEESAAKSPTDV